MGSSRPRKMYSMMATTSGMLARKQMMVSTGTYCMSVTGPLRVQELAQQVDVRLVLVLERHAVTAKVWSHMQLSVRF